MYKNKKSKKSSFFIVSIVMAFCCILIGYFVTYENSINKSINKNMLNVKEQSYNVQNISLDIEAEVELCANIIASNNFYEIENIANKESITVLSTVKNEEDIQLMSDDGIYDKLTFEEKLLAAQDPVRALKAYYASLEAESKAKELYVEGQLYLGNGDAFRHAYWNALMVKRCGIEFAQQMATAHESDTPEGLDKQMDLRNNAYGRWDGEKHINLSDEELAIKIRDLVTDGQYLRIVNKRFRPTNGDGLK